MLCPTEQTPPLVVKLFMIEVCATVSWCFRTLL